jgi:4-hydroxythreonine-4-phosphate dehydrogenase
MANPPLEPERGIPRLALTCGDPAGIGPEIVGKLLRRREWRGQARLIVLGPAAVLRELAPAGLPLFEGPGAREAALGQSGEALALATEGAGPVPLAVASAAGGSAALGALRVGHELSLARQVDALVTAPVNKAALHLAGERVEGQTELLGRWCGTPVEMLAIAGRLRVLLLTRHMPLKRAIERLDGERIASHLELLARELARFGIPRPRLACAGLNPHAGENGLLGSEEQELIAPALERLRQRGLDVAGPESPDTVFLRASQGRYDAVLALYHDQAFIPVKLADPLGGLTLLLGLPYLRFSPAHGTAFDIAGRGVADEQNLLAAVLEAARWVRAGRGAGALSAAP